MLHARYRFIFLPTKKQKRCSGETLWVLRSMWCLRKLIYQEILPNLPNVHKIQELWEKFKQLYGIFQQQTITSDEATKFEMDAIDWVKKFTTIYQSKNITLYIHIMAMHIPEFIRKYENLAQFMQQGLEKLNDQTTIDFARSTNHNYRNLEALKQLLQKKNRMEHLEDNGIQRKPKPTKCSICKAEGHNKRTYKNKQN